MFQKINISLADKIAASKTSTSDPSTNLNSTPTTVNGSPGDSTIAKPDLSGINSAGPDVSQKQSEAQTQTSPANRKAAIPKDVKFERLSDPEYPDEQDPRTKTPTPKKKGFMESLIDAKVTNYMATQTNTPEAKNGIQSKTIDDPNIQKAPEDRRVDRPNSPGWSPDSINVNDPGMPNQNLMDDTIDRRNNNPTYTNKPYTPIHYKAPKITPFRMPKLK
jgi:hypothetical protein